MKVFDASAVLAVIFDEPGADTAAKLMNDGDGVVSSVNLAEVVTWLLGKGISEREAHAMCAGLPLQVESFTREMAFGAGRLRTATRALGLSLGDRCCLALARQSGAAQVVTAGRPWKSLKGFRVSLIR